GAVSVYNKLESRIGANAELARRKHTLYLGQGDLKRAEKELTALIAAQPKQLNHRHLLAGFYTSQGEEAKARKVYQEILSIQPADVRAQLALQEVQADRPATAGGDDELLQLLARTDVDIDLKIGKILPLVQQVAQAKDNGARSTGSVEPGPQDAGLGQRAMQLAAELRRVHPDEAKAAAMQGDLFFHTGQLTKAAEAYRATLELDDTVYPVWEQLLATLYLDNQITELRKYAEEALDIFPNRPVIYVQYALGEALRANFGEANSLLDQARIMVSSQPEAAIQLETLSSAFASLEAGTPNGRLNMSHLPGGADSPLGFLLQNGGNAAALKAYDSPGNTNALFLELLGDALKNSGDKAAAASAYGRAKASGSKSTALRRKMTETGS
ncbi:MAG: tetratricopeptide repeat protein, partial [Bacteroidota bacterium]